MPQPLPQSVSIISEMITPALFIVASGSLLGTALARLSRVTDFIRRLTEDPKEAGTTDAEKVHEIISLMERRAAHMENSLNSYYIGVCCFVLSCFLIVVDRFFDDRLYWLPVATTVVGVLSILLGSAFMVAEGRLAMRQLHGQVENLRKQWSAPKDS